MWNNLPTWGDSSRNQIAGTTNNEPTKLCQVAMQRDLHSSCRSQEDRRVSSADVTTGGHAHHGDPWDHPRHEALGDTSGHDGGGGFGPADRMSGGYSLIATSRDVGNYVVRWTQVASGDAKHLKARRYHEKSQNTSNKPRPDANR